MAAELLHHVSSRQMAGRAWSHVLHRPNTLKHKRVDRDGNKRWRRPERLLPAVWGQGFLTVEAKSARIK